MSACKCCNNVYEMGCKSNCEDLELPYEAQSAGEHEIFIEYRGITHKFIQDVEYPGIALTIPKEFLNENYEHLVYAIDPDGEECILIENDIEYDCFKFKIEPVIMAQTIEISGTHYTPN